MEIGLHLLPLGKSGCVSSVDKNTALHHRLEELGLIPGTQVCCRYRTPGGEVTALEFRGTTIALRTRDMRTIRVHTD